MLVKNLHFVLQAKGKLQKSFEQGHCRSEPFFKKIPLVGAGKGVCRKDRLQPLFFQKRSCANLNEGRAAGVIGKEGAIRGRFN